MEGYSTTPKNCVLTIFFHEYNFPFGFLTNTVLNFAQECNIFKLLIWWLLFAFSSQYLLFCHISIAEKYFKGWLNKIETKSAFMFKHFYFVRSKNMVLMDRQRIE